MTAFASPYVKGTFNLGTDLSVTIIDNNTNAPIDIGGRLVNFKADPKIKEVESEPIDNFGYTQIRQAYGGWSGTLTIDRATGALDLLMSQLEQEYHQQAPQHYFTLQATIANSEDSSTTTWIFNYSIIKFGTSGDWRKDQKVEVTVEFHAQERVAA